MPLDVFYEVLWNNIRPKLETQIALARDRRIEEQLIILDFFYKYLEENIPEKDRGLLPNNHDFCNLPSIAALALLDDAQGDVAATDSAAVTERMLVDITAYKKRAKEMLLESLRGELEYSASMRKRLSETSADDALNQCCSYFSCYAWYRYNYAPCAECHHPHWRAMHPDEAWMSEGPAGQRRIGYSVYLPQCSTTGAVNTRCERRIPEQSTWRARRHGPGAPWRYDRSSSEFWSCRKKTPNPNHVLKAMHTLSAAHCDVELLPEGADTSPGHARQTIPDAVRAKVEERIAKRPSPSGSAALAPAQDQTEWPLLCRICKSTHKHSTDARDNGLPDSPEEIVWHLRRCHDKEFEKRDILFART
ncbi:hypothetical protein C8Q80DRAFT_1123827 [Daedaleopsis nitida]|nr:hypothetical protein C8Q80DRAFT_1123827 [Daedaleopsis nitida]